MAVAKKENTPIHKQLESMILDDISSGRLSPGDQVSSENEVAKQNRVSRTTVRTVYDRLVTRGVLTRTAGKGTFVAVPPVMENMSLLVGFTEKMNAAGLTATTRVLSVRVIHPSPEASEALRVDATSQVIEVERLRLLRDVPFVLQTAVLSYPRFESVLQYDLQNGRMTDYLQTATGFRLDTAEETVFAYPAGAEEARLLDLPRNYPVLSVRGVSYDTDGLAVRYSVARYHSGLVRLRTSTHDRLAGEHELSVRATVVEHQPANSTRGSRRSCRSV